MAKVKKPKRKIQKPSVMQHLKPSLPTGKGLGRPKIRVK